MAAQIHGWERPFWLGWHDGGRSRLWAGFALLAVGTLTAPARGAYGVLVHGLRHPAARAPAAGRLTQRELGIAVGYSEAQISRLEQAKRLPDPAVVAALFLPSLGLTGEPDLATRLHDLAKAARARRRAGDDPGVADLDEVAEAEPGGAGGRGRHPGSPAGADHGDLVSIPAEPRPNVDRPDIGGWLRARLAAQRCVLVSGPPGIGKTSLVATLARERAASAPVCWVTLTAGITTPAEAVIRRLARFLASHGQPRVAPLADPGPTPRPLPRDEQLYLLTVGLNETGALICLDNAHLLGTEPDSRAVVEHLALTSRAQFLAVSREESPLSGFDVFRLGGLAHVEARRLIRSLAVPDGADRPPVLSDQGAPAGLRPAAGPAPPGGRAALADPVAERLIERTAGSPMLIRLALGQVQAGDPDPAALVERLEAQPAVTGYLLQTTLAGLGDPARRLLAQLAVFRHPVDLMDERLIEACEALDGPFDVLGGLDELRRRQLIDHAARASLHPLVHDHAYAWLAGGAARRRRLHQVAAAYCDQVLADPLEASWHYTRGGQPAEAADLLAASTLQLIATGRSARAAELAAELLRGGLLPADSARLLLVARGDLLMHTEQAAAADAAYRDALGRSAAPAIRADVAWRLAQSLQRRGQVTEALELCRDAAAALTEGQEVLAAMLTAVQAGSHLLLSQYREAEVVAGEAAALADRIAAVAPDMAAEVRARAFVVLGVTARLAGQPQAAADWLRRSVAAAEAAGRGTPVGQALLNLAAIAHEGGDTGRAEQLYEEARAKMLPVGDSYGLAAALHGLAVLRHQRGAPREALDMLAEAAAQRRRLGDQQGTCSSEHARALVLLSVGRLAEAREVMTAVLAIAAELGERRNRSHYVDSMAMIALADADLATAEVFLAEASAMADAVGEPSLQVMVAAHRALAALAAGDLDGARQLADTAAGLVAAASARSPSPPWSSWRWPPAWPWPGASGAPRPG